MKKTKYYVTAKAIRELHEVNKTHILRSCEEDDEIRYLRDENFSIQKLYEKQKIQIENYQRFVTIFMGRYPSQYKDIVIEFNLNQKIS